MEFNRNVRNTIWTQILLNSAVQNQLKNKNQTVWKKINSVELMRYVPYVKRLIVSRFGETRESVRAEAGGRRSNGLSGGCIWSRVRRDPTGESEEVWAERHEHVIEEQETDEEAERHVTQEAAVALHALQRSRHIATSSTEGAAKTVGLMSLYSIWKHWFTNVNRTQNIGMKKI